MIGVLGSSALDRYRLRWPELLPIPGVIAVYFLFPNYLVFAASVMVMVLFALSLDLIIGFAGILTLGHGVFFGIGAYAAGLLAIGGLREPILNAVCGAAISTSAALLVGPFILTGAVTWVFIPVSIGALVGVREHDAGVASGLIDSSQQLGGAIGIAVASTVAAARSHALLGQGHAVADALAGGFHAALWVCGLVGLAAVPVVFLLVRRAENPVPPVTVPLARHGCQPIRPL